ncbi:type I-E CRISPR-associated protein Cas6/Cse3/CasE [Agromyces humi]|uniref:type I-E CRISPR-associated protein Cas6/Cse3/CasE n=1 Tax=Agromyces humi TaxID=1766800 RepID=UPI00135C83D0|nr:type I-E CRISPR-associated protein Cas6/Cse3/CasE [Agromyces humi]
MSYLTEVPVRSLAARFNDRHRQVMELFPHDLPGAAKERRATSQVLFAEFGDRIIVRSAVAPTRLPDGARTVTESSSPAAGTRVSVRAVVNPIRRSRAGGVRPVDDIETWIAERTAGALEDLAVLNTNRRVDHSGRSPLIVETVDATATITDPDALDELLATGVGRARSFGCGMILIGAAA